MTRIVSLGSACDTVRAIAEILTLKTSFVIVTTPKCTPSNKETLGRETRISGRKGKMKER